MAEGNKSRTIYLAKLASQLGRDNDFKKSIRFACAIDANLSIMERDILFMGYEKAVGNLREQLDSLSSHLKKQDLNAAQLEVATKLKTKVEAELIETCNDFIDLIDSYLLPAAPDAESIVFYTRMKGLQYYHMACTKDGNERQQFAERSRIAYEVAFQTANTRFSPANVERLRLECCRCMLYYEVFNERQRARASAIAAVRSAMTDGQPDVHYNTFTVLLDLMKFIEGIDNELLRDKVANITMEHGQEGGNKPQRGGSA